MSDSVVYRSSGLAGDNRFHQSGFVPRGLLHLNPGEITINLSHYLYLDLALALYHLSLEGFDRFALLLTF